MHIPEDPREINDTEVSIQTTHNTLYWWNNLTFTTAYILSVLRQVKNQTASHVANS